MLRGAHGMIEISMPPRTFLRSGLTVLWKESPCFSKGRKSNQQWLYYGDNDIETSPAFYQLNANGQYWQSFKKQVRPTKEELPGFANQPKPYHSKKATAASLAFISQCLEMVKLDYKENVQGRGLLAKPNHLLSLIILFAVVVGVLLAIQKVLS